MKYYETPITFWHVHHATRHFQFETFAPNLPEAKRAMRLLLTEHAYQYDLEGTFAEQDRTWVDDAMFNVESEESWTELQFGAGYRDGERIVEL